MSFLLLLIQGLTWIILIDVISSWLIRDPRTFPRSITVPLLDPVYKPIRAVLSPEKLGGFDLSPLVIFFVLKMIASAIQRSGVTLF